MSKRKVLGGLVALAGMLSGCGIADLIGDLKDLEDEYNDFDAGGGLPNDQGQESDGGALQRQVNVQEASQMLNDQGGQLATEAGGIEVPEGALTSETQVTIAEVSADRISAPLPSVLQAVAPAVAFTPHGQTFAKAVTLSLFHEGTSQNLIVLRLDNESDPQWERVDATFLAGVAYVTSTHFSIYNVSQCDPADGTCAGLLRGELDITDVPEGDLVAFDPPEAFGNGGSSEGPGTNLPGDDGEDCTFETVCQVISSCRPLADAGSDGEPAGPVSGDAKPACMEVEVEICWEECVTGGENMLPNEDACKVLPERLAPGCSIEALTGPCPFEIRCEGEGAGDGSISVDAGTTSPQPPAPAPAGDAGMTSK